MPNEFDEITQAPAPTPRGDAQGSAARAAMPSSRLVARLFLSASNPLRVRLLRCLMRPLSPLGAAGVAAGAFAAFLDRQGGAEPRIDTEAVAQVTSQQIYELAFFVEQVDPQALQQFASLASSSSLAMATTFSAAALVLLYRRLQPAAAPRSADAAGVFRPPA